MSMTLDSSLKIRVSKEVGVWRHCYAIHAFLGGELVGTLEGYARMGDKFHLSYIKVMATQTRKGVGTLLMESLCSLADEKGWAVYLTPVSQDRKVMSMASLRKFYASFGFKRWTYGDMIRLPEI